MHRIHTVGVKERKSYSCGLTSSYRTHRGQKQSVRTLFTTHSSRVISLNRWEESISHKGRTVTSVSALPADTRFPILMGITCRAESITQLVNQSWIPNYLLFSHLH
jgi:hypothetical protein